MHIPVPAALVVRLVFLLVLSAPLESAGQSVPAYRTLVDGYRGIGTTEIERTLGAPRDVIEAAVDAALSPASDWTWEELRGAAMLHSDVSLRALRSKDERAAAFHLLLARRLLNRTVARSPAQEDFAWRWYTTLPHMISKLGGRGGITKPLTDYAVTRWPSRSLRLYLAGLEFEWRSANDARVAGPVESLSPKRSQLVGDWMSAAHHFEEALHGDPSLHAASLHLGRIRMLQQKRLDATRLFRSALSSVDPAVKYLAALFLGSLEEREERFGEAEALYRDAVARIPYGQAAPLALAELLSRTGRDAEAREVLAANLFRPGAFVVEPMWAYGPPDEDPATQIDLLRMEVWK